MKLDLKKLLPCLAIPLAGGGLSAWLTHRGMQEFRNLPQPPLSPPGWAFSVAWTILYLLMGLASYLVYTDDGPRAGIQAALWSYGIQLAMNFFWPLLFFNGQAFLAAAIWLAALLVLAAGTVLRFYHVRPAAGKLMAPYLVWLVFALYLNVGVYLLNR